MSGAHGAPSRKKRRLGKEKEGFHIDLQTPIADIEEHVEVLYSKRDKDGLEIAKKEVDEVFHSGYRSMDGSTHKEWTNLLMKIQHLIGTARSPDGKEKQRFGSRIQSLGLGSSAGKSANKAKVDNIITSMKEEDTGFKAAMLSHFFYRRFLEYILKPSCQSQMQQLEDAKKRFQENFSLIWKNTKVGVVRHKLGTGSTAEPPATSLLAACINQLIVILVSMHGGEKEHPCINWASEYPLRVKDESDPNGNAREPRTDGILVAADPQHNHALRALVSMEAKLDKFEVKDRYQSRSNAVDAFAQQETAEGPWPLLMFRCTLRHNSPTTVEVLAFVPCHERRAKAVQMWGSLEQDGVFNSIVAATRAALDFTTALQGSSKMHGFCELHGNIAFDTTEDTIYKSFLDTDRRNSNIELIRLFVDNEAEEVALGERGSYIKMKWVGMIYDDDNQCDMISFLHIAQDLKKLHMQGICHGDIRVSNLILSPSDDRAKIVDFDLAGPAKKQKYPNGLRALVDGERHPDVMSAIEQECIGETCLEMEHDCFSLVAAMKCFDAADSNDDEIWKEFINHVEKGGCIDDLDAPKYLGKKLQLNARFRKELESMEGTGSPDKA